MFVQPPNLSVMPGRKARRAVPAGDDRVQGGEEGGDVGSDVGGQAERRGERLLRDGGLVSWLPEKDLNLGCA